MKLLKKMGTITVLMSLTACAQQLSQLNQDLASLNQSLAAGAANSNGAMPSAARLAQRTENGNSTSTQLVVPPDKAAAAALDAALPTIKKVIGLHQCMKDASSARLFSPYTTPGGENNIFVDLIYDPSYSPIARTRFHDKNKCVNVRAIDQVALLALNALQIRVVYLAEDSGEASNFQMQFMKMGDGSWKLAKINGLGSY